jgi:hypothetical protein
MKSVNRSRVRYYRGRIEWLLFLFFSISTRYKKEKKKTFCAADVIIERVIRMMSDISYKNNHNHLPNLALFSRFCAPVIFVETSDSSISVPKPSFSAATTSLLPSRKSNFFCLFAFISSFR